MTAACFLPECHRRRLRAQEVGETMRRRAWRRRSMWGGWAPVESRGGISGQDGEEERRRRCLHLRPGGTENGSLGLS
jgi:hypothetical protein